MSMSPIVISNHKLQSTLRTSIMDSYPRWYGMYADYSAYHSANAALAGMTKKYANAFSIIVPVIVDSSVVTLSDSSYAKNVRHLLKWSMTARGECLRTSLHIYHSATDL